MSVATPLIDGAAPGPGGDGRDARPCRPASRARAALRVGPLDRQRARAVGHLDGAARRQPLPDLDEVAHDQVDPMRRLLLRPSDALRALGRAIRVRQRRSASAHDDEHDAHGDQQFDQREAVAARPDVWWCACRLYENAEMKVRSV